MRLNFLHRFHHNAGVENTIQSPWGIDHTQGTNAAHDPLQPHQRHRKCWLRFASASGERAEGNFTRFVLLNIFLGKALP